MKCQDFKVNDHHMSKINYKTYIKLEHNSNNVDYD